MVPTYHNISQRFHKYFRWKEASTGLVKAGTGQWGKGRHLQRCHASRDLGVRRLREAQLHNFGDSAPEIWKNLHDLQNSQVILNLHIFMIVNLPIWRKPVGPVGKIEFRTHTSS